MKPVGKIRHKSAIKPWKSATNPPQVIFVAYLWRICGWFDRIWFFVLPLICGKLWRICGRFDAKISHFFFPLIILSDSSFQKSSRQLVKQLTLGIAKRINVMLCGPLTTWPGTGVLNYIEVFSTITYLTKTTLGFCFNTPLHLFGCCQTEPQVYRVFYINIKLGIKKSFKGGA